MRYLVVFLLLVHGLIHLMGFVKAFKWAEVSQLTMPISRLSGMFWLLSCLLFLGAAYLFVCQKDTWWMVALCAAVISQVLIFTSWQDAKFGTIANGLILVAAIAGYGQWSYYHRFKNEAKTFVDRALSSPTPLLTEADLQALPVPVQRYLRYAGAVGKPQVKHFKVEFDGQIRKNEQSAWMPFHSEQYNFMGVPTRLFYMKASMKNLPVGGYHRYQDGDAFMDIRLFSLLKVQYQDGADMGVAETVTFFNDMCCMAPATLIDPRIQWLEVADKQVKASFTTNGITISAWLYFNDEGALVNFVSDDRYAFSDNQPMRKIRWSTPLKDYQSVEGRNIAGYAEAIYDYPEGPLCYGTFRLTQVTYNPTQ